MLSLSSPLNASNLRHRKRALNTFETQFPRENPLFDTVQQQKCWCNSSSGFVIKVICMKGRLERTGRELMLLWELHDVQTKNYTSISVAVQHQIRDFRGETLLQSIQRSLTVPQIGGIMWT
ncbi:hypothetical protein CEXT_224391 [Caerostris extrusa]|uniref:Uncharacterized protein n=1 Tax=Caerostris extrusa TaxID=172846 RepID=A0AAV4VAJ7_CAEEX|nr:hypothetical protein CEXT_224391 [Caerostris extrusa]